MVGHQEKNSNGSGLKHLLLPNFHIVTSYRSSIMTKRVLRPFWSCSMLAIDPWKHAIVGRGFHWIRLFPMSSKLLKHWTMFIDGASFIAMLSPAIYCWMRM